MTAQATTGARTPVEEVAHWVAERDRWLQIMAENRGKLADAESGAAERVLDDPDAAEQVAETVAKYRVHADLARQAAGAANDRADAARVRAVTAEADRVEAEELAEARAVLDAFDAKTARLRAALEKHTVREWREWTEADMRAELEARGDFSGRIEFETPARWPLAERVEVLELHVRALRAAGAGESVAPIVLGHTPMFGPLHDPQKVLPPMLHPDGDWVMIPPGFEAMFPPAFVLPD